MKRKTLDYLICPACLPEQMPLHLGHAQISGEEIDEGFLECDRCGQAYRIEKGVASIVARHAGLSGEGLRYEEPDLLSAYLWSHYADLFEDPDSTGAYARWAEQISPASGACLDTGCATGRFSFEMSSKCEFVIGVDLSGSFVRTARQIMQERGLSFRIRDEGLIYSDRTFVLPPEWDSAKVDFLVADAGALPFRSGCFSCVASLNLLDKISHPLQHMGEASRTARRIGAQLLISDPFSWSEAVCDSEMWLGGVARGRFAGAGIDNIARLLSGEDRMAGPAWKIARKGEIWWKIRNHRNHFELIRSLFVKARR
ncbi:MAG: methyltransferase domain-containing protein [Syntrophobacteraceae bacterium]